MGRPLTKEQRKAIILRVWNQEVGELPIVARSRLPGYVKLFGLVPVIRAIECCADNDALDTSDDVLEAVVKKLRDWNARGWCSIPDEELDKIKNSI